MPRRDSTITDRESSHQLTDAWVRASGHVLNSVMEANRAALAAFGLPSDRPSSNGGTRPSSDGSTRSNANGGDGPGTTESESSPEAEPDWVSERTVESPADLGVGDAVRFTKTIDDADILAFARASGDTNPLHLSNAFAEESRFEGRIAHGTLVSGVVSAALARLPGQVIYLSQDTQYLNPVRPGDAVTAVVEVTEVLDDGRFRLSTTVTTEEDEPILEGEAVVLVEESPVEADSS